MDSLAILYLAAVPAWIGFIVGMVLGLVVVAVIEWREGRM